MFNSRMFTVIWAAAGITGIFTVLRQGLYDPLGCTMVAYFFVERKMPYHQPDNYTGGAFAVLGLVLLTAAPTMTIYVQRNRRRSEENRPSCK